MLLQGSGSAAWVLLAGEYTCIAPGGGD